MLDKNNDTIENFDVAHLKQALYDYCLNFNVTKEGIDYYAQELYNTGISAGIHTCNKIMSNFIRDLEDRRL